MREKRPAGEDMERRGREGGGGKKRGEAHQSRLRSRVPPAVCSVCGRSVRKDEKGPAWQAATIKMC